jgi:hypothetical protein
MNHDLSIGILQGLGLIFGVVGSVLLICWLVVDVLKIPVRQVEQRPQIIITREGQYECVRLVTHPTPTCRRVTSE